MLPFVSFVVGGLVGASITAYSKCKYSVMSGDFVNVTGLSTVTVNGKTYKGNDISITNGHAIVDDVKMDSYGTENQHSYIVQITGNPQKVETMGRVTVTGNCGDINTMGRVDVGGSSGTINTMGNVNTGTKF